MNKKLLPITLLCLLGLTACGNNGASESQKTESSISETELTGCTVAINNKADFEPEWHAGEAGRSLDLTVTPNCNISQYIKEGKIKITSSNESVAKASGKLIMAIGAGTATITVTYGDASDTVDVTILESIPEPAVVETTVNELFATMSADGFVANQYKYKLTGVITGWQSGKTDGTKYGNFYIKDVTNPDKELYVYGASATMSLDFGSNGLYSYTNSNQDWLTHDMTKEAMIGATVEIETLAYFYNTTKELTCKVISLTNPTIVEAESVSIDETLELEVQSSKSINATVLPENCNQKYEWSSDNTAVATVNDQGLVVGVSAGTATVTLKVGEFTDTCAVTVVEPAIKTVNVEKPVVGKQYKFGLYQETLGKKLYCTGFDSGNYSGSTEDFMEGALFELVSVEGGYNVKVTRQDESVAYMNLVVSGNYVNLKMQSSAATVWSWNTEIKSLTAEVTGCGDANKNGTYYVGTYSSYNTISPSLIDKASSSYVCHFVLAEQYGPVAAEAGVEYEYALWQNTLGKTLYMTTTMDGYYVASTEDKAQAAKASLVAVEGGYSWKLVSGETTKYVNLVASGTYVNIKLEDAASSVWTWDASLNTITTNVSDCEDANKNGTYYVGTFGSNKTFSGSKTSYASTSFVGHFYGTSLEAPIAAPKATAIALDKETATLEVGSSIALTATLTPANAGDEITWVSSDETVATVVDGVVTGVAAGTATITAKVSDTIKAECVVTVETAPDYTIETLNPETLLGYNGTDNVAYAAVTDKAVGNLTVSYTDVGCFGNGIQIKKTSGKLTISVADTVAPNGIAKIVLTAYTGKTYTLSVTVGDTAVEGTNGAYAVNAASVTLNAGGSASYLASIAVYYVAA